MRLLDLLGDTGTVVSPGLEAYGRSRMGIEQLIASLQDTRLQRLLEAQKQAEQRRQFEVTSGLERDKLAVSQRPNMLEEVITEQYLKTGQVSPELKTLWEMKQNQSPFTQVLHEMEASRPAPIPKGPGALRQGWDWVSGVGAEASPGSKSPEEYAREALRLGAPLEVIIQGLKKNWGLSDDEINSYLQERLDTAVPIPTAVGIPTAVPGPKVGEVGFGPLTQGNPQGGLASLSGSPSDFRRFLPPKEEILPRLQRFAENRRGGLWDVQQYIPRKSRALVSQ